MSGLSISRFELRDHCGAWLDLPHIDAPSKRRDVGNAFDELVTSRVNRGSPRFATDWPEGVADEASTLFRVWEERMGEPPSCTRAQVAYALTLATGEVRELGTEIGRDYAAHGVDGATVIGGTADIVAALTDADLVVVRDTKTGRQAHTRAKGIAHNRQLRALGYCAAKVTGRSRARVILDYVTPTGVVSDEADLDMFDLNEVIPAEIRAMPSDRAPKPGPHCDELFCPARAACPALRERAALVAPEQVRRLPVLPSADALRTEADVRAAYHALKAIDALSEGWWAVVKARADALDGVDLGNGRRYQRVEETRESIVVDSPALAVLAEKFGERSREALHTSLTKSAVAELARSIAGAGRPGAKLEREVLSGLRNAGSVRSKVVVSHEAVKVKERQAAE